MIETYNLLLIAGLLLFLGIAISTASMRLGLPTLLLFLAVGMIAGEDGPGGIPFDDYDMAFLVGNLALAIILLDGGMRTKVDTFRTAFRPALSLATVGVAATAAAVGGFATWLLGLDIRYGLLLGAIVGSTDAAAVFNVLHNTGIHLNDRVGGTLELESGANDPMAILLVIVLVKAILEPGGFHWLDSLWLMAQQFSLGAAAGVAGGWVLAKLLPRLPLPDSLNALMTMAFGLMLFAAVNRIGGSGFLAIYLLGVWLSNAKAASAAPVSQVMDGLAWLAQAGMFLILGLLVSPAELWSHLPASLAIAAFLMLVARPLAVGLSLLPFHFPWRERVYIGWVGLRGAVPIILAIYPVMAGVEYAALIFDTAFAVVLVSLVVQGTSVPWLARWLGILVPLAPAPVAVLRMARHNNPLELCEFIAEKDSPITRTGLPATDESQATPRFVTLIHQGRPCPPTPNHPIEPGDHLWVLLHEDDVPEVAARFSAQTRHDALANHNFFGEFVVSAQAPTDALATAYGVTVAEEMRDISVGDLLRKRLGRGVVVGDRVTVGPLRLTVRSMQGNEIQTIGLKLMPQKS